VDFEFDRTSMQWSKRSIRCGAGVSPASLRSVEISKAAGEMPAPQNRRVRMRCGEADVMAPFQDGAESNRAPGGDVAGPYDDLSRVLAGLPRPRVVRMSRRGEIMALVVSIALVASLVIYAASGLAIRRTAGEQNSASSQFPVYALWIAFIVAFAWVMLNVVGKQKQLLADGELAMALVTKRWMARNGPNIRYEFTTPLGEPFSRGAPTVPDSFPRE
jgi:hypothetical protein